MLRAGYKPLQHKLARLMGLHTLETLETLETQFGSVASGIASCELRIPNSEFTWLMSSSRARSSGFARATQADKPLTSLPIELPWILGALFVLLGLSRRRLAIKIRIVHELALMDASAARRG